MGNIDSLNVIDVASPCPADWEEMTGDDRVRHCSQCNLNVYNLSDMTEDEALNLVNETEGRLCVRYFRRQDGTTITRDCPKGLAAVRAKIARLWASAAALAGAALWGGLFSRPAKAEGPVAPPDIPVPEIAQGLMEIKGDIQLPFVQPHIPVEIYVSQQTPAGLVKVIKTVRKNVGCTKLGQPDPDDTSAMSERDRQTVEAHLSNPDWKPPTAGSKEHQQLIKYLRELIKRYPKAQAHLPVPHALHPDLGPVRVPHEVILGRLKAPREAPEEIRKALEKALFEMEEAH